MSALARTDLDARMTEKTFTGLVIGLLRVSGWLSYHTWTAIHSEPGFPDICAIKPGRLLFAELKSERGKLTAAQERWLELLRQMPGVEAYMWRPSDWPEIERIVRGEE